MVDDMTGVVMEEQEGVPPEPTVRPDTQDVRMHLDGGLLNLQVAYQEITVEQSMDRQEV